MARINIPPLTRLCLALCLCLSILTFALRYRAWSSFHQTAITEPAAEGEPDISTSTTPDDGGPQFFTVAYLTIVPARSIVYPWVYVSATLVEQNFFTLAITLATLFYGGRYLERAWGSAAFAKFLLVQALVPNLLTSAIYIIWFAASGNVVRSLTTISGGAALQSGFLVAFKQLVPEHTVSLFRILKIRVKHFPALFLLLSIASAPLLGNTPSAFLSALGFVSAWTYLRFFKRSFPDLTSEQPASLKGDASETFAFSYFFPEPLHAPVAILADVIWRVLVAVRICTPWRQEDIAASTARSEAAGGGSVGSLFGRAGAPPLPGSGRAEAERRRALALKALDQRLHAATAKGASLGETSLDHQQAGGA